MEDTLIPLNWISSGRSGFNIGKMNTESTDVNSMNTEMKQYRRIFIFLVLIFFGSVLPQCWFLWYLEWSRRLPCPGMYIDTPRFAQPGTVYYGYSLSCLVFYERHEISKHPRQDESHGCHDCTRCSPLLSPYQYGMMSCWVKLFLIFKSLSPPLSQEKRWQQAEASGARPFTNYDH